MKHEKRTAMKTAAHFLGVTSLWSTAFLVGRYPLLFPKIYIFIVSTLISIRYYLYKKENYHYFLFDFCYILNGLLIFQILFPTDFLFTVVFCLAHGPVGWATAIWKNAFVFHSIDKITSVYIHILPCVTIFVMTWCVEERKAHENIWMNYYFTLSMIVYSVWQTAYYFFFEKKKEKIENGERVTSYTFLKDRYNVSISFRRFVVMQAFYTVVTVIPTILLYNSKEIHFAFIVFLISVATYNGSKIVS
eukprot:NODE_2_length_91304_cov_0.692462.p40 type:complete len:247 gc:universal NODE_2_length_91304_cov_0.692462:21032-21772(+)